MPSATLSILGLYNYWPAVFDYFKVPEGADRDTCIDRILLDNGELESLYAEPHVMAEAIGIWCRSRQKAWERMLAVMGMEYNPIENYNRLEEWIDDRVNASDRKETWTDKSSATGDSSREGDRQGRVNGFDGGTEDREGESTEESATSSATGQTDRTGNVGDIAQGRDTHKGHLHGNIGVTTTQQMINEELDLTKWDFYQVISDEFRETLCVGIW